MYTIDYPQFKVPYKLYNSVLTAFNKIILAKLFSGSEELKMPFRLGTIYIVKYKPKNLNSRSLSIDFHQTKLLGKTIYHLNDHSDGYKYRLFWSRIKKSYFVHQYSLSFVRLNKRKLALIIKNKEHDYIEIS